MRFCELTLTILSSGWLRKMHLKPLYPQDKKKNHMRILVFSIAAADPIIVMRDIIDDKSSKDGTHLCLFRFGFIAAL